jgi:hypothetical protein
MPYKVTLLSQLAEIIVPLHIYLIISSQSLPTAVLNCSSHNDIGLL